MESPDNRRVVVTSPESAEENETEARGHWAEGVWRWFSSVCSHVSSKYVVE